MRRAIEEAKKVPLAPFGAILVDGTTATEVAAGHNRSVECPTFHGEIDVIQRCAADHTGIDWSRLVLYTTAESCPMCQAAALWAGVAMVVYGSSIPFLEQLGWWQIDIRSEEIIRRTRFRRMAILGGVLEEECNALFHAVKSSPFLMARNSGLTSTGPVTEAPLPRRAAGGRKPRRTRSDTRGRGTGS
jgi:tRNA(Arg) A34 adenosine deaminase TadA